MKEFASLIRSLEDTSKTNAKVEYLKRYFLEAPEADRVCTIALFTHRRPKRQVNTRMLAAWAMQVSMVDEWLFQESYDVVGDLAETIALILPKCDPANQDQTLTDWINFLMDLEGKTDEEKEQRVKGAWSTLPDGERFVFNKLITGGFRVGVSQNLIVKALADAFEQDASNVAYALSGDWKPSDVSFQELLFQEGETSISKPYPFFLAYSIEGLVEELGAEEEWSVEWKWDGIRSQLIVREGELFLWSRGEELITEKFPELAPLADMLPNGTVIDGELLPFKDGKPLSFNLLQTRIGRKNVTRKHLKEAPASILSYDLLEWGGQDLRGKPLAERRAQLDQLIRETLCEPLLQYSAPVQWSSWAELSELRKRSRDFDAEGFMIKRQSSVYQSGRKRGDWWKWKVDPYTIDAVMVYAQKGHGKRADLYSDYTFAVWREGELVPFAKAYSGLTDRELYQVTQFVRKHTLEKFGPVRTVTPTLVFEIHFEGINRSPRHKSGIAVRFPRIHRWRHDKKPEEANSLDDLMSLIRD